ncbi:hypothetical protein B0T17DRAFT_513519 [Bombardia bombarda]|uniref:Uncharacterized protein n=1 Tax=Bombardia bombarda TaxID=252184 RepID=A0AA39XI91_9PEZI|nr:hypothetical protein B0T17DRAFT_513519 [Bombardia bombarda]
MSTQCAYQVVRRNNTTSSAHSCSNLAQNGCCQASVALTDHRLWPCGACCPLVTVVR